MNLPLEERCEFAGIRDQEKIHQSAGMRGFWEKKLSSDLTPGGIGVG